MSSYHKAVNIMFIKIFMLVLFFSLNALSAYQPVTIVTVSGTPTVTVSGTPTVQLSGASVVSVSGTTSVSGTVSQNGTWNINNITGTVSLPTGAATEATLSTLNGKVTAVNTGAVSGTVSINGIAAVSGTVSQNGAWTTGRTWNLSSASDTVSGTVTINGIPTVTANAGTNLNTSALALESGGNLATLVSRTPSLGQATMTNSSPVVIASNQSTLPVSGTAQLTAGSALIGSVNINGTATVSGTTQLTAGSAIIGSLTANQSVNLSQIAGTTTSTGNGTAGTGVQRVAIASDNTAFNILNTEVRSASATVSSVTSSATNVTCLASNSTRRKASFFNDSTSIAYLKMGATATSSDYSVQLASKQFYEIPTPVYTGQVDCIWSSANGSMKVTWW